MPRDAAAELIADLGFIARCDHPGAGANSGRAGSGKQTCGTGRSSGCANHGSQTSGTGRTDHTDHTHHTHHTGGCGGQAGSASCCDNQTGKRNHHSCTGGNGYNGGTSGNGCTGGNAESACADDCSGGQVSTVRSHPTSRRQTG